ncbi:DUF1569 domain-containing protein [Roseivirga misakiensis]|uniref:DUF1569 domain-containing protein n=1 Tax=Roseivirga misakiensis TaxID=1563681 RepID=A0A1E5SYN4_9BACT|nr:DUF1569 domain-containing protein [Roseivirga misakiensis]OEK04243.1 hypothetical protein BFP71_12225 [Roseivirga misakiensis]
MKNLYHKPDVDGILERLEKLTPNAERQWGKMDVAQMLAHLNAFLEIPLDLSFPKRMLSGRIIGRFFKSRYVSKKRFSKNSPTGKNFIMDGQEDFEKERTKSIALVQKFYENGPEKCTRQPHQFFGKLSPDEWAIVQWKHFDHHLRQFDV